MEQASQRLDTLQPIELADGVEVRLRIAGLFLRGGALGIDLAIQWLVIIVFSMIFNFMGLALGSLSSGGLTNLLWFVIWWWYPVFFEASAWGATPGKKILGLRVVQNSGSPITMGQSLLRNLLRYADGMPFFIGGIGGIPTFLFGVACIVATKRFQRLGDLAAGTVVIYDKLPPEPVVPAPPALQELPPTAALRSEEVRALSAFRDRAGLWSEGRRVEIADHASELSGSKGPAGVSRLIAMAHWLQRRK